MSFVRMIQESLSGSYKNHCPDNSRMFVRVLQECCPDVARIINKKALFIKTILEPLENIIYQD